MVTVKRKIEGDTVSYVSGTEVLFIAALREDAHRTLDDQIAKVFFVSQGTPTLEHWLRMVEAHIRTTHGYAIKT